MNWKRTASFTATALLALALYAAWLWQPARQVQRHTAHFLKAVERRNSDKIAAFLADDYSDRWGHDKEFVVRETREVFRHFIFIEIQNDPAEPSFAGSEATLRSPVKISGQGSPIAQYVMEKVNALRTPFFFTWRRGSWKPWDWRLMRIDHSELEIGAERAF